MPSTPLFGFGTTALGLNGINQGLQVQANQIALQQAVRDNARDYINFASQLDQLGQFADFRQQGLTPSQALFATSQGSVNPLTAQAGLNNFSNRASLLAPFAVEAARQGNPTLLNSIGAGPGVSFDATNPTSGLGLFGAPGTGQQTAFNIRNNVLGGALSNPTVNPQLGAVPVAPTTIAQQPVQFVPVQQFQPQQVQQPVQQPQVQQPVQPQMTRIQQNAELIRQIQQATQRQSPFANNPFQAQQRPQQQEAVSFPTVNTQAPIRSQANAQRGANGYTSFY